MVYAPPSLAYRIHGGERPLNDEAAPALASGRVILHYRLTDKLGQGGMGEVWAAQDSTLDRLVAIKALPAGLSSDPERLARFEREAKVLASLNHPNIATVFSVHVVDGVRYLIMEYVPGEDLSERIARGPVPTHEALELSRQIASALGAAHEQGVIHRDLKPANVRITPDGVAKVLDFGLAKAFEPGGAASASAPGISQSPTFLGSMTPGVILGTAGYMAPEQARGQGVDRRADLWALGVILYEMLTGTRAFEGETISDTLAAVLRAEPDRALLPKDLPGPVHLLLDRLLQKDLRKRLRDVGGVLFVLDEILAGGTRLGGGPAADGTSVIGGAAAGAAAASRRRLLAIIGVGAAIVLAVLLGFLRPGAPPAPLRKYALALDPVEKNVANPSLSPDGRWLAFTSRGELWVRDFRQGEPRKLTEGLDEDFRPAWSPDSRFLAIAVGSSLMRVAVEGGSATPICTTPGFTGGSGGTWLDHRTLLFTRGSDHLYRVPAAGGVPTIYVARRDSVEVDIHHPCALPRGKGILIALHRPGGSPDQIVVLGKNGERKVLVDLPGAGFWMPTYDARGYIVYGRIGGQAGVWAVPFDLDRVAVRGEPFLIATAAGQPTVSGDGLLACQIGAADQLYPVIRVSRAGAVIDTLCPPRAGCFSLALSPDERMLAVETREPSSVGIWLDDLARASTSRFAFDPASRMADPAWSPDGRMIAYVNLDRTVILTRPADGSQPPRELTHGLSPRYTPDGRHIMFQRPAIGGHPDLWIVPVDAPTDTMPLLVSPNQETRPVPAPQGGYYLYLSDESGRRELYLRPYPDTGGRWQVSAEGADLGHWSPQGDRIFYFWGDDIYEVAVRLSPKVELGTPRMLFRTDGMPVVNWGRYDCLPTRDPDVFLFFATSARTGTQSNVFAIVENWPAEFAPSR